MRSDWHKSSYSNAAENCVEVREGAETLVRDTQNRHAGHLEFQAQEWGALLKAVRGLL
ncbi:MULTISPECIES: DUF397 domain-containing protein [Nocardiopsis]|uniref:DUF397 domain-containing protein n=1 Tax=Nocardiopsis dassonvillei (strain ATCC 23218 / DSM 43111 / CIP 107115 / JCM 7437 / KCTC 9190 / NBRC 14626 / NCTC 10488 / NRRL B-5397 / IMRU 509) TaxID=446468 RepID=D7AXU3_NOCDD|nr:MULTISPECIES: DUF397 domain-containing protein [Nocardiopsis]ADH67997.1 protein of unknown function DUF397 [Nocardiopsis dassonvillei subsp. dassonvillei DSM 43111]NKY79527.1 DUF397 domain-containing protein [Nocardiopsis dassonvillei]